MELLPQTPPASEDTRPVVVARESISRGHDLDEYTSRIVAANLGGRTRQRRRDRSRCTNRYDDPFLRNRTGAAHRCSRASHASLAQLRESPVSRRSSPLQPCAPAARARASSAHFSCPWPSGLRSYSASPPAPPRGRAPAGRATAGCPSYAARSCS